MLRQWKGLISDLDKHSLFVGTGLMIIYRVQRVSDSIDVAIDPLRYCFSQEVAEAYAEKVRPKIAKEAFYKKVEVVEVKVY